MAHRKTSGSSIYSRISLAYEIRVLLVEPHHHQAKRSKYPKTRKLTSQVKRYKSFVSGRYKGLKLMGMGAEQIRRTMDICVKVRVLGIVYLSYKTICFLEN
ncbi:hypothetical protein EXW52_28935 (plasmid) [Bacillus mycoides]|nr:hypothetical protein EXW52_28935 [Bacillus mycoides]